MVRTGGCFLSPPVGDDTRVRGSVLFLTVETLRLVGLRLLLSSMRTDCSALPSRLVDGLLAGIVWFVTLVRGNARLISSWLERSER